MTKITTHIAAFVAAALMTVATQGTMLWQFDNLARSTPWAHSDQTTTVVTLDTVTITARRA